MGSEVRLENGFLGNLQFAPFHWPSGGGRVADAIELVLTGLVINDSMHMANFGSFGRNVYFPKAGLLLL